MEHDPASFLFFQFIYKLRIATNLKEKKCSFRSDRTTAEIMSAILLLILIIERCFVIPLWKSNQELLLKKGW